MRINKLNASYLTKEKLLFPIWQLAQCVLMNTKDGRDDPRKPVTAAYNPWWAYNLYRNTITDRQSITDANVFFIERKVPYTVQEIKEAIEDNLIDSVRIVKTEAAYDKLIDLLGNHKEMAALRAEREQIVYDLVIGSISVGECERFLKKYAGQHSAHFRQVMLRRDSLAFVALDTTATACKKYLTDYPNSRFNDEVTQRMHRYAFNELPHTSAACKEYLRLYPKSQYAVRVTELQAQYAFDEAKRQATINAYQTFLTEYRSNSYARSQGLIDEMKPLLEQALKRKYISSDAAIVVIEEFINHGVTTGADISAIRRYYANLLYMPTSGMMNGSLGLTGRVRIVNSLNGAYTEETLFFNQQGLLTRHQNSKTQMDDSYEYSFDSDHGYQLSSKYDDKTGKTLTYTTKYNDDGSLAEVAGSDGTKVRYTFDGYRPSKIVFMKGNAIERTDVYDSNGRVEKSQRNGLTMVYTYNAQGDVVSMEKMRGNTTMDRTTYEYTYPTNGPWITMTQYNNGSLLLTKRREYNRPQETTGQQPRVTLIEAPVSSDQVYERADVMPQFPRGGDQELMRYLVTHIHYPTYAEENGIQGKVVSTFVVERDGSVSDVKVVKGVDPSLDKEAVRVIRSMPKWIPGRQNGRPVRVKYTVPIIFGLNMNSGQTSNDIL